MDRDELRKLLEGLQRGDVELDAAVKRLSHFPFVDTEHARVDTQRSLRIGIPEVIFGLGKTPEQIVDVAKTLREAGQNVLVTRLEAEVAARVQGELPESEYDEVARLLWIGPMEVPVVGKGTVAVVSAGTSDRPVAAEAAAVARCFGNEVETLADVGVAGIHRLLASHDVLANARVLIVVAGMEGALPSVVGGLVDKPVIAVPTSVGYGAALGGIAALLGMLTSCSSNVSVVNIDNGYGAAYVATLINRL
ncbi:MAG: nickel pincer cofactor biosynthesis protein LarB [Myxococcota bacterium]|nr:nickel pincer cofactor biosynthesis protein LarB [Myxococcota bacterium]